MKRVWCVLLLFAMICAGLPSLARGGAETVFRCEDEGFSVTVPEGFTAGRDETGGLVLTPDEPDGVSCLKIRRRAHPFNNIPHYLTGIVCDELDEEYYVESADGGYCDFAGRRMIRCDYFCPEEEPGFTMVRMIGAEAFSDTEFIAVYTESSESLILAALETVVRDYSPDETPLPEARIRPLHADPESQDFRNGTFALRVEDSDRIAGESRFTAGLYRMDVFSRADVLAMAPGDTIRVNDRVFTVTGVSIRGGDGSPAIVEVDISGLYDDEEYDGPFEFRPLDEGENSDYCAAFGDWETYSRVGSAEISLPLPDGFVYYDVPGGELPEEIPAEYLISAMESIWSLEFLTQYNTTCRFQDGELVEITSWSYPFGPADWTGPVEE